nr:uncharacterized protein I303_03435 [Kwoniella dejecticola CBS 10117]OBR85724.1 hypothetical protein I303_03435 [Kwoniella dejecticola CBS 10117]
MSKSTLAPLTASDSRRPSESEAKGVLDDRSAGLGIGVWEGKAVFSREPLIFSSNRLNTPRSENSPSSKFGASATASGSIASPISISSASPTPSPQSLSRPRAVPHYTSPLPRTTAVPPSSQATPSRSSGVIDKPIHPFFNRTRTAPPTNQPRYVAHYSSTEASSTQSSQTQRSSQEPLARSSSGSGSQSASSSRPPSSLRSRRDKEVELLAEEIGKLAFPSRTAKAVPSASKTQGMDFVQKSKEASINGKGQSQKGKSRSKAKSDDAQPLPFFHYSQYVPPPQVVYTTSTDEANDLLGCLKGSVLGFDLEWPPAGRYKMTRPDGSTWEKKVGMTWDPVTRDYVYGQGRTALMQFCDEKLVVLIHLGETMDIPSKAIEILRSASIYKLGVQVNGDGRKLLRDFPQHFPSTPPEQGLNGLLELSALARGVDPINTGPGNTLIGLATLSRTYLGKELDKDKEVRKGDWFKALDQKQRDYAANDVYASLQIYKKLRQMAEEKEFKVDLDKYLSKVGSFTTSNGSGGIKTYYGASQIQLGEKMIDIPEGTKPPPPAHLGALGAFIQNVSIEDIAMERGIKISTVE